MKALGHFRFALLYLAPLLGISCSTRSNTEAIRDLEARNSILLYGQVIKQGMFSLDQAPKSLTVSGAVVHFGQGFAPYGDLRHVVLKRGLGSTAQRLIVDVKGILRYGITGGVDPLVQAGDVIIVNDHQGKPEYELRLKAGEARTFLMLSGVRQNSFSYGLRRAPIRCNPRAGGGMLCH